MEIDVRKLTRQQQGVNKWGSSGGRGTLWYDVGVGKTYTAILIFQKMLKSDPLSIITIVVPTDLLRTQWNESLYEHLKGYQNNIKVLTASEIISKGTRLNCKLLVIDEIHEFVEGNKLDIVCGIYYNYKFILGLTGSWERDDGLHYNLQRYCPVVDRIDEQEAIESGFTSPVVEYNLAVEFTQAERQKYDYYVAEIAKYKEIFNNDFKLALQCIKGLKAKETRELVAELNGWSKDINHADINKKNIIKLYNPNKIYSYAIDFISIVQQRLALIYTARNKVQPTIDLCRKYNVKTIIFNENTDFADRVYHELNFQLKQRTDLLDNNVSEDDVAVIYHSNVKTIVKEVNGKLKKFGKIALKKLAINQFTQGIRRIFVTSSVSDRGLNINDIWMGIILSGNSKRIKQNQRKGRLNRIEFNKKMTALMVNIYVKDSIDESMLKFKQRKSNNVIKTVTSVEQIQHIFENENL